MLEETASKIQKIREGKKRTKMLLSAALILLLATSVLVTMMQPAKATTYTASYPTTTFCVVSPNPIGVNQPVSVVFWLGTAPPQNSNQSVYTGWSVTIKITKPDGTTETKGPYTTDSVGGGYLVYTPTKTGNYTFKAIFAGQEININSASFFMALQNGLYYFGPSEGKDIPLTVQATSMNIIDQAPLPTGYWSNPITSENQNWNSISGNWLTSLTVAKYTTAPTSAHILWTKPVAFGGIVGGESGWGISYYTGIPYEPYFTPPVIISGRLYYNTHIQSFGGSGGTSGVMCVDLRTGAKIWEKTDMPQITCGQTYFAKLQDGYGVVAYLWASSGGKLLMYDAFTGDLVTTISGASSLSPVYGPSGELLVYSLSNLRLTLWNSTQAIMSQSGIQWSAQAWRPPSALNYSSGIQWNVSVPAVSGGTPSQAFVDFADGVIVAEATITATMNTENPTFVDIGYSTTDGSQLWTETRTGYNWGFMGFNSPGLLGSTARYGEGVYAFLVKETLQVHAFNVKTGDWLWSTESLTDFTHNDYSMYDWRLAIAYGKLFTTGYSGDVIAFDLNTGSELWTFTQDNPGYTTPYGSWPALDGGFFADGKMFLPTEEHTPNTPMLRGYRMICIDTNTGKEVWHIANFGRSWAIADGILVDYNVYDHQAYAWGKGNSATTVTASAGVGNSVTIQGTVTDQSPGQTALGIPAAGTPAIADEYMSQWMEYLYIQQEMPTNATGVPVTVMVTDQSGAVVYTKSVTSDISGKFVAAWTPTATGTYTVNAIFDGSNSYYASYDETFIVVGEAASASPTVAPTTAAPTTAAPTTASPTTSAPEPKAGTDATLYVAIAAVIVIAVIAAIAVILRRRK
jgi:hypothetical protein